MKQEQDRSISHHGPHRSWDSKQTIFPDMQNTVTEPYLLPALPQISLHKPPFCNRETLNPKHLLFLKYNFQQDLNLQKKTVEATVLLFWIHALLGLFFLRCARTELFFDKLLEPDKLKDNTVNAIQICICSPIGKLVRHRQGVFTYIWLLCTTNPVWEALSFHCNTENDTAHLVSQ